MKLIISFLLICVPIFIFSQLNNHEEFDTKIQNVIDDSTSNYYYPKLLAKAKESPSSITVQDSYYLYYGRKFQYVNFKSNLRFMPTVNDFNLAVLNKDCEKMIKLGKLILERNPVDMNALACITECITNQTVTDSLNVQSRYKNLVSAILSTGNGKSTESPIKIANLGDEAIILYNLGVDINAIDETVSDDELHIFSTWTKDDEDTVIEKLWKY